MNGRIVTITAGLLLCSMTAQVASAQQAAPHEAGAARKSAQAEAGEPRVRSPGPARGADKAADKRVDRVDLDTTTVTGNRELPKLMYVVPWKKSDIGDLVGKPMNSLLDEVLAPVDRDVFRREVTYYNAVNARAGQNPAPAPPPSPQGEK
ncbi:MAG: hypothetical protein ACHQIL_11830 [Steroidobacterales bacterium]